MEISNTEIIERVAKAETEITQLKSQTAALQSLAESVAVLVNKTETMGAKIDNVEKSVKDLAEIPGNRWNLIITGIISALVSGGMGFFLATFR